MNIIQEVASFVKTIRYEDIPPAVVHETKRLILDSLGCAVGGISTKKGEIALRLAQSLGGPPDASLLGIGGKVSATSSAFAAGELMNALDYEALLSPPAHATPYVLAAPLAIGEWKKVPGSEFIVAAAVAHELSTRLAASLDFGPRFAVRLPERGLSMSMPTPGYGLCAFAGAAAAGRLMGLGADKIAHAMGLAGSMVPVPMLLKFVTTVPASLAKYQSSGALSMQEVLSVMWAALGCSGDTELLEGEYGFWRATGCDRWTPEVLMEGLGKEWVFPTRLFYKKFPCCGAMQSALAHFSDIIMEHDLFPEDITAVTVKLNPLAELPLWRSDRIENHVDAQFNTPFVIAAVANRMEIGPSWQWDETLENDAIRGFMKKVMVITDLDEDARTRPDVEVRVGQGVSGKVFFREGWSPELVMGDKALAEKFERNTRAVLGKAQREKAVQLFFELEDCSRLDDLVGCLLPR
ncbi:MAG: MmgE/PrpD family protein [Desulfobacterales bacterium]|nr:MmgE/PrpD family protein [Desulfobacterales bacterium]